VLHLREAAHVQRIRKQCAPLNYFGLFHVMALYVALIVIG